MSNSSNVAGQAKSEVVSFVIENYDEMYNIDPEIITKLEIALTKGGAIPAKIDFPSKLCCATIIDESVTSTDILTIIEQLGFQAKLTKE